jgi:hypothetical protein
MRKLLVVVVLMLLAVPAFAQTAGTDLEKGYNLGEMGTLCNLVALELSTIQELAAPLADISDENYNSGTVTDDDVFEAQLVLAYVMWRCQFMLQPVCGAGLGDEAFTDPGLAEFKTEGQAVLGDVVTLVDAFLAAEDDAAFAAAGEFAAAIGERDLVARLYGLSDKALATAGLANTEE